VNSNNTHAIQLPRLATLQLAKSLIQQTHELRAHEEQKSTLQRSLDFVPKVDNGWSSRWLPVNSNNTHAIQLL